MKKLKINSVVTVISGDDKRLSGSIIEMKDEYVKVSGLKLQKKSIKKDNSTGTDNFVNKESWIHISNIKLKNIEKSLTNKKNKNS